MYLYRFHLMMFALFVALTPTILAQPVSAFYPLRVGNSWTYSSLAGMYTETVLDTQTDTQGNTWYLLSSFRHADSVYLRLDSEANLWLKKNNIETLWLKFATDMNDKWQASFPGGDSHTVTLQSKTDSLTVPHGMFTNVYRFHFEWMGADNDLAEYYVQYIGPIRRILYGFGVLTDDLVSFNGTSSISGLPQTSAGAFQLGAAYPNPASDVAFLPVEVREKPLSSQIVLYDMLGRVVYGPFDVSLNPGYNALTLPLAGVPMGLYTVTVSSGTALQSQLISVMP